VRQIKFVAIIVLLIILSGVSGFFIFGSWMIDKSMNTVLAHPPYKISQAAQKTHDGLVIMDWCFGVGPSQ
jgi:hypothetical protein